MIENVTYCDKHVSSQKCLFFCSAFLILYVDDIEFLDSIEGYLNKNFSMKDVGEAAYILGIKIYRDRSRRLIGLSQSTYIDKVLKKFKMDQSKKGFFLVLHCQHTPCADPFLGCNVSCCRLFRRRVRSLRSWSFT